MVSYLIVLFLPTPPPPGMAAQVQGRPRGLGEMKLPIGTEDQGPSAWVLNSLPPQFLPP